MAFDRLCLGDQIGLFANVGRCGLNILRSRICGQRILGGSRARTGNLAENEAFSNI